MCVEFEMEGTRQNIFSDWICAVSESLWLWSFEWKSEVGSAEAQADMLVATSAAAAQLELPPVRESPHWNMTPLT